MLDGFVEAFVGPDRALKRLSLQTVGQAMQPAGAGPGAGAAAELPTVRPGANLRDALSLVLASGAKALDVVDESGARIGQVSREVIFAR